MSALQKLLELFRLTSWQIGDPKMDSGSFAFDSETNEDFDFTSEVSVAEVVWLMDELLRREV